MRSRQLQVVALEVDVVGDEREARADGDGAGGGVHARRALVGPARGVRGDRVAQLLEALAARRRRGCGARARGRRPRRGTRGSRARRRRGAPSTRATSTQTGISSAPSGTNGTTSAAPKRGWAPSCSFRSMRAAAVSMPRKAASAIAPSWPTKVTTLRLWVASLCTSSRCTPSTSVDGFDDLCDDLHTTTFGEIGDALDEGHVRASLTGWPLAAVRPVADEDAVAHDDLTAGDHAAHQVDAEVVGQLLVRCGVEHEDVAALARLQAADLVLQAQRRGAAHGGRVQGLGGREPLLLAGERDDELQVLAVAGARVEIGGQRDGDAGVQHRPRRRVRGVQRVARAGQHHGGDAGGAQRRDVLAGRRG